MKIEHIAIWTSQIERLKTFYETYFNARSNRKYVNPEKDFTSYFLSFDTGARLEIMQKPSIPESKNSPFDQATGIIHLAFSTGSAETVDALTARLAKDGYSVLDGPRKTGDGYYESTVLDPEGNRIEITI